MYQTNSTNSLNSASQSKMFLPFQQDMVSGLNAAYNPDHLIIDQVFKHYHQRLKQNHKLTKMVLGRKIDPDYIDQFQMGYSDRTLGFELQSPKTLLGSQNRGHLQRLGLLKHSGHEFFQGALVIPYCNDEQQVMGAYGRRPRQQRRSPAYHLYWNTQKAPLFNASDSVLPQSLILCKSALDALTLLTAGFDHVVATMGIKGFNEAQLLRLQCDGVNQVFVAFDNTPTANHYALLLAQALDAVGIESYRIQLPVGQDVNRFALSKPNVAAAFSHLINEAAPLWPGDEIAETISWVNVPDTLQECLHFYLKAIRASGKSHRTIKDRQGHLERFLAYCQSVDVQTLSGLSTSTLTAYRKHLVQENSAFTGKPLSPVTRKERMDAVFLMLRKLKYYGLLPQGIVETGTDQTIQ